MVRVVPAGIEPAQSGSALVIPMRHNEESTEGTVGLWKLRQLSHRQCSFRWVRGDARLLAAFTFKPNVLLRFSGLALVRR